MNPLLSPPGGLLFQTYLRGGGGGGLICEWGLISFSKHNGITSSQETTTQSEKPELEVMQRRIKNKSELPVGE